MTAEELRAIIQSDYKLWENSLTESDGETITKTIDLPYNIGEYSLIFEGVANAEGRRNAAAMWAGSVRAAVDEAIGEEAVTARAAQRASLLGADDDRDGGPSKPCENDAEAEEIPAEETVSSFSTPATFSANPSRRLDELRAARDGHRKAAEQFDLEIKALAAYMEVMNANDTTDETPTD